MSKHKRKKNQIGVDDFGLPIYKRDKCTCNHPPEQHDSHKGNCLVKDCLCKGAYHHSSATLKEYVICDHICEKHGRWSHKVEPNVHCHLSKLSLDYVPCEDCLTFGLNVTKEEKVKLMSPSQQAILVAWRKTQGKKKNEVEEVN